MILSLAAMKIDSVMFFPSPHNTVEQQKELLRATGASHVLYSKPYDHLAKVITNRSTEVPDLLELLDRTSVGLVSYEHSMKDLRQRPFVIVHTSGTTGFPKPLPLPHGYYTHEDMNQCADYEGNITSVPFQAGARVFTSMSMWHAGGIFYGLLKPILNQVVTVQIAPGLPITADLVKECLKNVRVDALQLPPSFLADMVADESCHPTLSSMKYILTGSGPMPEEPAQKLPQLNRYIFNNFGLTETDLMPLLPIEGPGADWQFHRFHPASGASFRTVGDGLYELLIVKTEDGPTQPCFEIYSDAEIFHTEDVFTAHGSKRDMWKWVGRLDDIITFSTGEKMFAASLEQKISALEGVKSALLVGPGRQRPALLIELQDATLSHTEVTDQVWVTVDELNRNSPSH
jgi:acyl-coenzyme A synthetase/AMP-(fatty) acid ligase